MEHFYGELWDLGEVSNLSPNQLVLMVLLETKI